MRATTRHTPSADFIRSRQGVWLKKNWFDATFNFCYRGSYSALLPDYLASQATPFVFIDIGANQGFYSLVAVQSDMCTHALAFEPARKTHALLAENIQANSCAERITAFRLAISDQAGDRGLAIKPGHSGAATLRKPALGFFAGSETVQTVGPEWLRHIRPDDPGIIKVDVEGHEEIVLQSLSSAGYLDTAIAVYYEVDSRWSNAGALQRILLAHGFRFFTRDGKGGHHNVLASK